ncbi:MAG TPA: PDGLE domain-containing protein, partial [Holophaga sp.]|nr:PDGLE domain-containing protein [Holophaga sp.]
AHLPGRRGELAALGVASYVALAASALCAAVEFGLQPVLARDAAGLPRYCPYPLAVAVPAMLLPHLLVAGFVEAAFTVGVFGFIRRVSPGTIHAGARVRLRAVYAVLAGLVCLSPVGLLASGTAWGEWGADEIKAVVTHGRALGFVPSGMAGGFSLKALLPDYAVAGLPGWTGYVVSAAAGAALLVVAFKFAGRRAA